VRLAVTVPRARRSRASASGFQVAGSTAVPLGNLSRDLWQSLWMTRLVHVLSAPEVRRAYSCWDGKSGSHPLLGPAPVRQPACARRWISRHSVGGRVATVAKWIALSKPLPGNEGYAAPTAISSMMLRDCPLILIAILALTLAGPAAARSSGGRFHTLSGPARTAPAPLLDCRTIPPSEVGTRAVRARPRGSNVGGISQKNCPLLPSPTQYCD
jgi:hypothetical protein